MESLYKVDKIDGKGFGWIASRDIKAGTLICKEKYQFVPKERDPPSLTLMETFFAMSENDQKEFLNLSNLYYPDSDPYSLSDDLKEEYFDLLIELQKPEFEDNFDTNLLLKIMCIHRTNAFGDGSIGIKISRINHSCCSNSQRYENEEGVAEIRATSKILKGQEISLCYMKPMTNFKERQNFCQNLGFVCSCDLCKVEEINNDDEIYEKFQSLEEEAEKIFASRFHDDNGDGFASAGKRIDKIEKLLATRKQMYNLAKNKKAPIPFIYDILKKACGEGINGYLLAAAWFLDGKMEYFKQECEKLSKIGYQIAKMHNGQEHPKTKEWKKINQDFENWARNFVFVENRDFFNLPPLN